MDDFFAFLKMYRRYWFWATCMITSTTVYLTGVNLCREQPWYVPYAFGFGIISAMWAGRELGLKR